MSGVDIGLYDYDRHNTLYYFIVNSDERIYLRYGGRDADSPETYLNLDSLELALRLGLEQHEKYRKGELPKLPRPEPFYPRDIPLLKRVVIDAGRCVECHLIADYDLQGRELDGTLNKLEDMFVYPDIKTMGIHLDVPKGLVVGKVEGAVADAGMEAGDVITAVSGTPVLTFGDLQYRYNKTPRDATTVELVVDRRGESHTLTVALPKEWWYTDLWHRYISVDPQLYFWVRLLAPDEKEYYGFPQDGFASEIIDVDPAAKPYRLHDLKVGDVVYSVDGVEEDEFTQNLEIYVKLNKTAGEDLTVGILRDGEKMDVKIRTRRERFRKRD